MVGRAATKAVEAMKEGDVVLLQNTRFRGAEETKNGEEFRKSWLIWLISMYATHSDLPTEHMLPLQV